MVNNARAAKRLLAAESPRSRAASEPRGTSAAERASQVIRKLRVVLRKDEFRPGEWRWRHCRTPSASVRSEAVRRRADRWGRPRLAVSGDGAPAAVLLNLLLNALDAVLAACRAAHGVAQAGRWETASAVGGDSGPGFESARDGIFEPSSPPPQGLGMVLAICRSIAETHGGDIVAANRPQGGAVVRVNLPLARGSREAAA
jgi:C4-dicarboxylate-specific signal transduction histidine kinase